ncbi:hypothetical protein ACOMHN_050578 [Nucella lapillus]
MESNPLTPTLSRSIDTRYRRMLRSALGIFYPDRISNDELFAKTQLPPLSMTLRRRRLRLVGHILRMQTRSKSPLGELLLNSESGHLHRGQGRTIKIDPGWKVADPDTGDTARWTMDHHSFDVDQHTGIVYSKGEYDYDRDRRKGKPKTLQVKVKDKGDKRATATLLLTIKDRNDNAPRFNKWLHSVFATNCSKVGKILNKRITAIDRDSKAEGNNQLKYSGSGSFIAVLATGQLALLRPCEVGQRETIQGLVTDQGQFPGPLTAVPTTIQFRCIACPTPPVTNDSNSGDGTTEGKDSNGLTGDDGGADVDGDNDADLLALHLGWGILGALLGLLLAGVLTCVICGYCAPSCARWLARRAMMRKVRTVQARAAKKTTRRLKQVRERKKKEPDPPPDIIVPPPPPPPPPDHDPILFGFWKETYVDRDQRHMPLRDVMPATVTEDKLVEEREKEEEEREKEERMVERRRVEENYLRDMVKHQQDVNAIRHPPSPAPPPPPKKKK